MAIISGGTVAPGAQSRKNVSIYEMENLAAGADIAARPVFCAPAEGAEITKLGWVPQGSSAGVDNSNPAVLAITDKAANSIASVTYNTGTQPPADGVYGSLGTLSTHAVLTGNEAVLLAVTQGATADLPGGLVVIEWVGYQT